VRFTSSGRVRLADDVRIIRAAPALFALIYPAIVWCGTAVSPVFLVAALVVPLAGVAGVHHTSTRYRRTRAVALAVVTAPALFSWLGGLLDFQTALPFHALAVWMPLWTALLGVAIAERASQPAFLTAPSSRLAVLHGASAVVVTLFVTAHLANHLAGLQSGEAHLAVMRTLRLVYRQPFVETLLLTAVAFQALSGLRLLAVKPVCAPGWPDTLQRASGAYLAVFLLSHLTAALRARHWRGIDTNWQWLTSDSMLTDPWSARLAPYYFLGIVAFGIHGGLGLRQVLRGHGVADGTASRVAVGAGLGALVVATLVLTGLLRA